MTKRINSQFTTYNNHGTIEPNFQNCQIIVVVENKKIFHCIIVNIKFSHLFSDESTPSKNTINTGNRHIDQKTRNLDLHDLIKLRKKFEKN